MQFFTFKLATISRGQGHLGSYFWTRCLLPQAMPLPRFVRITEIDLEKSAENLIFEKCLFIKKIKMATISRDLEKLSRYFALQTRMTQGICLQTLLRSL